MRKVLLRSGQLRIHSYPTMVYLGSVLGFIAGNYAAHLFELDALRVFIAMLLLTIPAFAGGRLLFVVTHWRLYRQNLSRIWQRSEGGGRVYGGLPVAFVMSLPLLSYLNVPFWRFWDAATVTILVGMTVGRVGCLLNGCCAGRPTNSKIGIRLPDLQGVRQKRYPSQLLEIAWTSLLLVGAMALWGWLSFPGALFFYAIGGYGFGRFILEGTREEQDRVRNISIYRVMSIVLMILSLTFFLLESR